MTLTAEPANETAVTYDGSNSDVFDATGRDGNVPGLGYQDGFLYGIGVNNTLIENGDDGVTSDPLEIGYYGHPKLQDELGDDRSDALSLDLGGTDLYGGTATVSYFYSGEQSGEVLSYILYLDGNLVDTYTVAAVGTESYSPTNPGIYTFDLADEWWDEIIFEGAASDVADASDFLLEEVTGDLFQETCDILAAGGGGGGFDAGDVVITRQSEDLTIEVMIAEGWDLLEAHADFSDNTQGLAGIGQSKKGNFAPGQFDYHLDVQPDDTATLTISLEDLHALDLAGPDGGGPDGKVVLAFHTSIQSEEPVDIVDGVPIYQTETGWGDCLDQSNDLYDGRNWAQYIEIDLTMFDPPSA